METSGIVFRPIPCFSGVGFDTHSSKYLFSSSLSFDAGNRFSGELKLSSGSRDSVIRPRVFSGISDSGFPDEGHLRCYDSPPAVCGTKKIKEPKKKKEEEKKNPEKAAIKKRLKVIKGLSKDLSMFYSMGFGLETEDGLIREVKEKKFSEAAEVLLAQLKLLRAEKKEMKRKRKEEEKARSSDIQCGEVVDMRTDSLPAARNIDEPQVTSSVEEDKKTMQVEGMESRSLENFRQGCCNGSCSSSSSSAIVVKPSSQRIEVCMGGKCKKLGAATLLEEFERKVGVGGGAVVGCKCMGKCKDGPNVRVLNHCNNNNNNNNNNDNHDEQRYPMNPLCIGVGLEDVDVIVANLYGEERKDLGPTMTAT